MNALNFTSISSIVSLLLFALLCALIVLGGPEGEDEKDSDS